MNKLTLLIALLSIGSVSAQIEKKVNDVLKTRDFKALEAFTDTISDYHNRVHWSMLRDLAGGYREGVLSIEHTVPDKNDPNVSSVYNFLATVIATDSAIVYYQLSEIKNKKSGDDWVPYRQPIDSLRDENAMQELNTAYRAIFLVDLNEEELFTNEYTYGSRCGWVGMETKGSEQISTMVSLNDRSGLLQWLQSPNAEKQVYAVDGFYQLTLKGIKLTEDELRMIAFVKAKKGRVAVCSGCIHTTDDIGKVTRKFKF